MIKIYDSLSGKKQNLPNSRPVRLFVCGPTVYDFPHIGHARTYVSFDTFSRYLKTQKIKIFYLQNITDVDNRIIDRAKELNISPIKLARKFESEYHKAEKLLKINSIKYARATEHISQIIKQIQTLIKKGHAYKIENDGYYFDVSTFPEYGKLSKRTAIQAEDATSRVDESENKKNKADFVLWKFPDNKNIPKSKNIFNKILNKISFEIIDGEPLWYTSLGWGRPGWHIEDTAITEHYFGPQYDIHGGAIELKFPHHEAEITQQEAASGKKPLVKIWMHTGVLFVDGKKMSKSLKNFIKIEDFIKKYSSEVLRLLINLHHYRSPINYTEESALQASNTLKRINKIISALSFIKVDGLVSGEIKKTLEKTSVNFQEAMDDDFNTPKALASIFEMINIIEPKIWKLNKNEANALKGFIVNNLEIILGITLKEPKIPQNIAKLAQQRELLRNNKQFAQSDLLRKQIEELGYIIEDTPMGPFITKS